MPKNSLFDVYLVPSSLDPPRYSPPNLLDPGNLTDSIVELMKAYWPSSNQINGTRAGELKRLGSGINKAVLGRFGDRALVIKTREGEQGHNPEAGVLPRNGCVAGCGAFTELLINLYIKQLMTQFPGIEEHCVVPKIGYAKIEHPVFYNQSSHLSPSSKVTAAMQMHIEGCKECTLESLNSFDPKALNFLAIVDIITINSDRHIGNILEDPQGRLVLIDHGYCLSREAASGGRFCWLQSESLNKEIPEETRQFIENLDESVLEHLAQLHCRKLKDSVTANRALFEDSDIVSIDIEQLLPHTIAVRFLKAAIKEGWNLSDIGMAVQALPVRLFQWEGGVIGEIYEKNIILAPEKIDPSITSMCSDIAQAGPAKYRKAYEQAIIKAKSLANEPSSNETEGSDLIPFEKNLS